MWTALFGIISGLITGVLPDAVKEIRDTRNHGREIDFLKLQHELQMAREKAGAEDKMREAEASLMAEEMRATREHLTAIVEAHSRPTGIVWIDGFNALLRPVACSVVIALFLYVSVVFVSGVTAQYVGGHISVAEFAAVVWGSMIGEAITAVIAFLFGYRGARKCAAT